MWVGAQVVHVCWGAGGVVAPVCWAEVLCACAEVLCGCVGVWPLQPAKLTTLCTSPPPPPRCPQTSTP